MYCVEYIKQWQCLTPRDGTGGLVGRMGSDSSCSSCTVKDTSSHTSGADTETRGVDTKRRCFPQRDFVGDFPRKVRSNF